MTEDATIRIDFNTLHRLYNFTHTIPFRAAKPRRITKPSLYLALTLASPMGGRPLTTQVTRSHGTIPKPNIYPPGPPVLELSNVLS